MTKHTFWMKASLAGTVMAGLLLAAPLTSSAGDHGYHYNYSYKGYSKNGGYAYHHKSRSYAPYGSYNHYGHGKSYRTYSAPKPYSYPKTYNRRPYCELYR